MSAVVQPSLAQLLGAAPSGLSRLVLAAFEEAAAHIGLLLPTKWDEHQPHLAVLVPDPDWMTALQTALDPLEVRVWTCKPDKGGKDKPIEALQRLELGSAIWLAEREADLPRLARISIEQTIIIPGLSSSAIARAVSVLTGQDAVIADADWEGLDLPMVAAALRPKTSAPAVLARLRAMRDRQMAMDAVTADAGSAYPLWGAAADWHAETLALIAAVRTGRIPPSRLRHTLLAGPPGTGKSSLVRQVARQAGIPLRIISIGALFASTDGYLNSVTRAVLAFFKSLQVTSGPIIGLIEELDAISSRDVPDDRNGTYWNTLITTILVAIDQLNQATLPILLVGTTNRPDAIDLALIRAGRIGHLVEIGAPDSAEAVVSVLRHYLETDLTDLCLDDLARPLIGRSAAALADHVTEARNRALLADRPLQLDDLVDKSSSPAILDAAAWRRTALHEAAHAVIAKKLGRLVEAMHLRLLDYRLLGATVLVPQAEGVTLAEHQDAACIGLAGRAADIHISHRLCDGSASDLIQASQRLAKVYLCAGLGDRLLALPPDKVSDRLGVDLTLQRRVDAALDAQAIRAEALVRAHQPTIEALAELLLARRTLSATELKAFFKEHSQ